MLKMMRRVVVKVKVEKVVKVVDGLGWVVVALWVVLQVAVVVAVAVGAVVDTAVALWLMLASLEVSLEEEDNRDKEMILVLQL